MVFIWFVAPVRIGSSSLLQVFAPSTMVTRVFALRESLLLGGKIAVRPPLSEYITSHCIELSSNSLKRVIFLFTERVISLFTGVCNVS